jgi:NAD(P)-dependent dehydrogenase (short-subunit alcohol dehydrogenase family)
MPTPSARHALKDWIAIVTGASRGAGRGIAVELGAAGATVYVTGRSTRDHPAATYGQLLSMSGLAALPGSIDDTADEVTRAGGRSRARNRPATSGVRSLLWPRIPRCWRRPAWFSG